MATEKEKNTQQFDFETIAVVLYVMMESGVTLGTKHYEMMSAIDGTRGKDSFSWQFRKVKARAKELQDQVKNGGVGEPVKRGKGGVKKDAAENGEKKKGAKRGKCIYYSSLNVYLLMILAVRKARAEEQDAGSDEEGATKNVKT